MSAASGVLGRGRTRRCGAGATLLLAWGLTACHSGAGDGSGSSSSPAQGAGVREAVSTPPSSVHGAHCRKVDDNARSAESGGVRAGPFGTAFLAASSGVAKFWVATTTEQKTLHDALIRVEAIAGVGPADPAVYVRRADAAVAVTPAPKRGPKEIYNGTIFVPTASGTKLRITVTIGDQSGCFDTHV